MGSFEGSVSLQGNAGLGRGPGRGRRTYPGPGPKPEPEPGVCFSKSQCAQPQFAAATFAEAIISRSTASRIASWPFLE